MTTYNHTAIATGAAADAATFNGPLGELDSKMGNVAGSLTTSVKTNLVSAINEVDANADTAGTNASTALTSIGTLASLTTTEKTNLVGAVNEVDANADTAGTNASTALTSIGTLASLTTTEKSNLVGAINEVDANADTAGTNASTALTSIGTLASLTTTAKTNLVAAVNEVDANADTAGTNASTALTSIGTLASLTTTEKSNLVGAINEVDAAITGNGWGLTASTLNIDDEIEIGTETNVWVVTGVNASPLRVITSTGDVATKARALVLINRTSTPWEITSSAGGSNIRTPSDGYAPAENEVLLFVRDARSGEGRWHLVTDVRVGNLDNLDTTSQTSVVDAINEVNSIATNGGSTDTLASATTLTIDPNQFVIAVTGSTEIETIAGMPSYPHVLYLICPPGAAWSIALGADNILGAASITNSYFPEVYEVVRLVYDSVNGYYFMTPGV